jgi:hypothetical protein
VEACEPPRRLLLSTSASGEPDEHAIEVTLAADGDRTVLVWEERGMSLDQLAAYGAGIQVHVEDLAAHLAGRERGDADARWNELLPAYGDLAANLGQYGRTHSYADRESRLLQLHVSLGDPAPVVRVCEP